MNHLRMRDDRTVDMLLFMRDFSEETMDLAEEREHDGDDAVFEIDDLYAWGEVVPRV